VGWSLRCGRCRFMVMEVVPRALKRQKKKPTRIQTENEESDASRLPIHDNGTEAETPDSVFS